MKRVIGLLSAASTSPAVTPVVIGLFFILYIVVAFFTDETLIALMELTRKSIILTTLLALIPLGCLCRMVQDIRRYLTLRRCRGGDVAAVATELFDETVELSPQSGFSALEGRLQALGYRTGQQSGVLSAWRGVSLLPAQLLFTAALGCFFIGVILTTTLRSSDRRMVIEGELMPTPGGGGGIVERISLFPSTGAILAKELIMEVGGASAGRRKELFGLYPPSLHGGAFVYPRYIGISLHVRFFSPEIQSGYENHYTLNTFPPGKEDSAVIPGTPYRVIFSIPQVESGTDRYIAYMTGKFPLQFKLLKGSEAIFTGSADVGSNFTKEGYRLELLDARRLVVTDFIRDYGVFFIWAAGILLIAGGCVWVPIRLLFPRQEMVLLVKTGQFRASSRAEGRSRAHAELFHETLDFAEGAATGGSER